MGTGIGVDIFMVTVAKVKEVEGHKQAVKRVCVCVCARVRARVYFDGSLIFHFLSINKPSAHPAPVLVHNLYPEAEF